MKFPRMPSIKAFFGPEPTPGRHQFQRGTHRADSGPKHRGTGTAKRGDHRPKHSREARGYDHDKGIEHDDYVGTRRRSNPGTVPPPKVGQKRAKRGIAKGKPVHALTDR